GGAGGRVRRLHRRRRHRRGPARDPHVRRGRRGARGRARQTGAALAMGIDSQPIQTIDAHPRGLARLWAVFAPVRRDEVATVVLLTINVFVLLTCYYVLKVVREPLILLGGGAELKAYASAGQTLLLLAVVPAFGALARKVDRVRLLTTVQLIAIGCLVAFYFLAQVKAPIGLAFYLWLGIFSVLVVSNFW